MQAEFWQQRWESNQIGFHQEAVNPCLQRHWPGLGLAAESRVLVPLCGKSLDLSWLAAQGMRVLGVELAQKAVEDFFAEHQLEPQVRQHGLFQVYEAGPVELWCGDIFALSAADVADCRGLYDRAAMIALPPSMRERYAAHLSRIMAQGSRGLLITLDYEQSQIDGPPFSVPDENVQALLAGSWQLHELEVRDVLEENLKFVKAGASRLEERVYQMSKR